MKNAWNFEYLEVAVITTHLEQLYRIPIESFIRMGCCASRLVSFFVKCR